MKFRLTYSGPLRPTNRDPLAGSENPLSLHKHEIRREFHRQLKQLWATNKFLKEHKVSNSFSPHYAPPKANFGFATYDDDKFRMHDVMSTWHQKNGFNFLPLVSEKFSLLCSLDILFLRHDIPGSAISAGDIDNRIKTLIDALRLPQQDNELFAGKGMAPIAPLENEYPFYCLLEDDKQVSHFSVETDTLLEPEAQENNINEVKIVITVTLRPYDVTMFNLSFS